MLLFVACALGLLAPAAQALDPSRPLGEAKFTSWGLDPSVLPPVVAMAQTPDGFLWLGTSYGLYRFDGINFDHIPSEAPGRVSDLISMIVASRDGSLYVAYNAGGVDVLRDGHLRATTPGAPTGSIQNMAEAPNGDLWVETTGTAGTRLRRYRAGIWNAPDRDVVYPPAGVGDLLAARDGSIWATVGPALIVLRPGSRRFVEIDHSLTAMASMAQAPDGGIWIADLAGLRRVRDAEADTPSLGSIEVRLPAPAPDQNLMFDRHGVLWNASAQLGIVRVTGLSGSGKGRKLETYRPRTVIRFAPSVLLEDREGDLWAATTLGLVRFRPADVARMTEFDGPTRGEQPGVSGRFRVMADGNGRIYVRDGAEIWAIDADLARHRLATLPPRNNACPAIGPGLWVPDGHGHITRIGAETSEMLSLPFADPVDICSEDRSGRMVIGFGEHGLWRREAKGWRHIRLPPAPDFLPPYLMTVNETGGVFSYVGRGWVSRIDGDAAQTIWARPSATMGFINTIAATRDGALLGAEAGLVRYDGQRFRFLSAKRYPFLHDVSGIVQTSAGDTWMLGASGIVRIDSTALARAFAGEAVRLTPQIFQYDDGLSGVGEAFGFPDVVAAGDGRIWFTTNDGVFWINPSRLNRNPQAPPLFLRKVRAGGRDYAPKDRLELPEGTSRLQIDYTAVSLSMPERVRFRYRMEGVDDGWIDAGNNRQAIYTNLGPGDYRFQVIAANENGVWNRHGATFTIHIPPTFVQSRAFLLLCVFASILLIGLIYELRTQQITRRLNATMRERIGERERIARELHDTLLQSVQGLLLRFQALAYELPAGNGFRSRMDDTLSQTRDAVAEARDRVQDLRSEERRTSLADDLGEAARDLLLDSVASQITLEGAERPLAPAACEEIRRIVWEALFNVARHARASRVDISIVFTGRALAITIVDNGIGIDAETVSADSLAGHFGIQGMRERAKRLKARLQIESLPGAGTSVKLRVPASVAYRRKPARLRGRRSH